MRVATFSVEYLPTCVKREEEEDDKHDTENGQYDDPDHQVHGFERSLDTIGVVWDDCGLVQQIAHGPANCLVLHLQKQRVHVYIMHVGDMYTYTYTYIQ